MINEGLERTIAELADVVSRMDDVDRACQLACDRLQEILGGPVAILERAGPRWRLRCGSPDPTFSEALDGSLTQGALNFDRVRQRAATVPWAWVPLGAGDERVMLIPADWRRAESAAALELTMRQLGYAIASAGLRDRTRRLGRLSRVIYGFSRRLVETAPAGKLYQFITDHAVKAGRGQQGALALYAEADGELGIVATSGYPRLLVDHVRVRPGEGIIGHVFETQRPLLVADISKLPHHRRRPRYRTTSFMATPILARGGAMGVICVTDRVDGAPFEAADLEVLRALAGSAALALTADDLARQAELLGQWAAIDPLTELFNRRYFRQRLQEEFQRARRYNLPLSLLLLDIDDFKRVNDVHGHSTGDAVLRAIADVLRRNVRTFDLCCRYGGEEFVLVLPGSDAADALRTADRVRQAVAAQSLAGRSGEPPIRVTVSVGAVTLDGVETIDDLIEEADRALYEAKQRGKNQIRAADSSG